MSEQLTWPKCDEPLEVDEEWQLLSLEKLTDPIRDSIQGDYAHKRCLDK